MINHGDIFEIPLDKNYGYAYVQLHFTQNIDNKVYPGIIVKPLNKFSLMPLNKNKTVVFSGIEKQSVLAPILMWGLPKVRGNEKWYKINTNDIELYHQIPHFKNNANCEFKDWSKLKWEVIQDHNPISRFKVNCNYREVKHLGLWRHTTYKFITSLLTMLWIYKQGDDPLKYYKKEDFKENFYLDVVLDELSQIKDIPIECYKEIRY